MLTDANNKEGIMKKVMTIVLALTLLFAVSNLFAQAPSVGLTGKGIKAGVDLAKFTGSDATDQSMKTGFTVGGFITYSFTDLFGIQPELLYSMKGSKVDVGGTTVNTKLNYIEIPVLFRVQLVGAPTFKPNFYVGPELGILLSAKREDVDIKDDTKSTDFGIIGGVGADFPMGAGKLTFDARYDLGLSKVVDVSPAPKVNNSAITFLVGYGF